MAKTVNLALAGGGVKGIAFVGATVALEEAGYTFARIAGTSAGAVVGGLLAAGFSGQELRHIIPDVPYKKFQDEGLIDKFGLPGKVASLIFEKGIYEGDFFCHGYDELLGQKNVHRFGDVKIGDTFRFTAQAADISRGQVVRFPKDLITLGINPDQQLISEAVRASISVPFYYEPVRLNGNYLVDGSILANYPIDAFETDPLPTIGIKLSGRPGMTAKAHVITDAISYARAVLDTMISNQDQAHFEDPTVLSRTIFIDTDGIMATEFNLSSSEQQLLFHKGYEAARSFLTKQNNTTIR